MAIYNKMAEREGVSCLDYFITKVNILCEIDKKQTYNTFLCKYIKTENEWTVDDQIRVVNFAQ